MSAVSAVPATPLSDVMAAEFASWGVEQGGCAFLDRTGVVAGAGDVDAVLPWASVTKIVAALAVLDVVEDGLLDLDAPAGPPGATVRHLLGHASGLVFDEDRVLSAPGARRVYSNVGIDRATQTAVEAVGATDAASLLADRVLMPLGMTRTRLLGLPAHGIHGPVTDLCRLAAELLQPAVLREAVVTAAITPSFPDLAGLLPGFGRQDPNDWGLGIELRGRKDPHWMPASLAPEAFGHFGIAGSFCWVDRELGAAAVALTGTAFGPWAAQAWPVSAQRWIETWAAPRRQA